MQQFNIDISQPRGPLVLYVSQGDSLSRFFEVTVTDNGAAYEPPTGAIYTVRFGSPGMPAGWYDTITEVGGGTHPAVVVDGNTYTVEIAEQALGTPGENALVLIVSDATGYTLASWAFVLQVARVPGYDAPEATVYYNALSEQVAQVLANAQAAAASAVLAESWAVGGTGTRPGEDTNNAEYWASEAQRVSQGALGWYETEQALQAAHPTGTDGQWAIIGSTDTIWTWDSDTNAWVNSGSTEDLSNYYTKEQSDTRFATAEQGAKANSAVQSINGVGASSGNVDITKIDALQNLIAPVGYIFAWAPYAGGPDLSTAEKVAAFYGFGTWQAYGAGRALVSLDVAQTEFNAPGKTGGEKTHQLSVAEMPKHTHKGVSGDSEVNAIVDTGQNTTDFALSFENASSPRYIAAPGGLSEVGGGAAHNNLQPYITVYYWQRIA